MAELITTGLPPALVAAALAIAARHRDMPTLGGAGPVLVVTVDANDLENGTGRASVSGAWGQLPVRTSWS